MSDEEREKGVAGEVVEVRKGKGGMNGDDLSLMLMLMVVASSWESRRREGGSGLSGDEEGDMWPLSNE